MDNTQETQIQNVSDTALWVATYRAMETERHDALFKDPYAARLSGERGRKIAESLKETTRYTSWSVIIRTCIIDSYIENLINEGVDTIVNLGAGLDARPYRMNLPTSIRWIEVDYPSMIEHKQKILANDKPRCRLERVAMDLSQGDLRRQFLKDVNATSKNILILTEGVVPYLTEAQTAELAADLRAQDHISYWIVDYFSPKIYKYMRSQKRMEQMKNAPIQFF